MAAHAPASWGRTSHFLASATKPGHTKAAATIGQISEADSRRSLTSLSAFLQAPTPPEADRHAQPRAWIERAPLSVFATHVGIGAGEHQPFVTVGPPHDVRRGTLRSPDLDD